VSLTSLAAGLRDASGRLAALDAGDDVSVEAVFSWSYQRLPGPARRMFRLLGIHPGPDISAAAAVSLSGTGPVRAHLALRRLTETCLITEHAPGRFRFHDLLREYAAGRARALDGPAAQRAAIHRVLDHYLHSAYAADQMLRKFPAVITPDAPQPGVIPELPPDFQQAMEWFDAEQLVLTAVVDQAVSNAFDAHGWQLPLTLGGFFDRNGHTAASLALQEKALAAAQRLDDRLAQAQIRRRIGSTLVRLGSYQDAGYHYQQALSLCTQAGDRAGQARAHLGLGYAADHLGRHREALTHCTLTLALAEQGSDRALHATALSNLGWCHARLGEYEDALLYLRQALGLHQEVGDRYNEAHTWDSLGYVQRHLGQNADAVASYQQALALFRQVNARADQGTTLDYLGDAHRAAGHGRLATEAWQQAVAILDELRHPRAIEVRGKL